MGYHRASVPRRRVLAVDDDPVSTLIIEDALAEHFLVDSVHSGEQALKHISRAMPDLVLLDVMMDGMDGFEVCAALRARPGGKTLPVVMLTSQDDTASIAHAFEVGATDFIGKPIHAALLPHRVNYLMRAQDTLRTLDQREQRIVKLAYYDPASGLPNRDFVLEYLQRLPTERPAADLCVLAVEIEALKRVGRGWGQAVTKPLASDLADRLGEAMGFIRPCAPLVPPQDWTIDSLPLLARVGDSAFTVLTQADPMQGEMFCQQLLATLSQPLRVAGIELPINATAGIAYGTASELDAETLLRHALTAAASCRAPGQIQRYHQRFDTDTRERLSLEARLRRAIDRGELELWYQPKVDSHNQELVAAEGLVRWRDPQEGLIPPGRFIPLAEETGLIVPLTDRVLDIACADLRRMRAPGLAPVEISVNISAAQLDNHRLPEEIAARLRQAGLPAQCLELEITERALMARVDTVIDTLIALHDLGLALSLDDFGTGYSSLGYLGRFPLDTLKIDRSFVADLGAGAAGETVVRAVVSLARGLGLKVIAEGIETPAQADWLRRNGCRLHQGYLYSRPLELDAFLRLLDPVSSLPWKTLPCPPQAVC